MAKLSADVSKQIVALKNHVVEGFNESYWRELAVLTNHLEKVERHPRLLRSLTFGDDDYDGFVLSMLHSMVRSDRKNLDIIAKYVEEKCSEAGEYISSEENNERRIVFSPNVFRVPNSGVDYSLVSAMMPFTGDFTNVYDTIKTAASSAGFSCTRADDIWDDSTIIQDIFSLIFQSYVVVCDFTGKNPNVFYEAGLAHTLGKYVIPITQNADDIPFDLRHHRFIPYLNNVEGREELKVKLVDRFFTLAKKRNTLP